jgi:hypothetical protein
MSEYLVEAYVSPRAREIAGPGSAEIGAAAAELTREGQPVRLIRTVLVPDDETGFYLFEAATSEAVVEAARRCGLRFERVVEAHSD